MNTNSIPPKDYKSHNPHEEVMMDIDKESVPSTEEWEQSSRSTTRYTQDRFDQALSKSSPTTRSGLRSHPSCVSVVAYSRIGTKAEGRKTVEVLTSFVRRHHPPTSFLIRLDCQSLDSQTTRLSPGKDQSNLSKRSEAQSTLTPPMGI